MVGFFQPEPHDRRGFYPQTSLKVEVRFQDRDHLLALSSASVSSHSLADRPVFRIRASQYKTGMLHPDLGRQW